MMIDIETSLSKNLDAQLWKSCFHNVIERFRQYDNQSTENQHAKQLNIYWRYFCLSIQLNFRVNNFFLRLFVNLNRHSISKWNYISIRMHIHLNWVLFWRNMRFCVLNIAFLILAISLGMTTIDLQTDHSVLSTFRYKETNRNGIDYSEARK